MIGKLLRLLTHPSQLSSQLSGEIRRFLVVGFTTVAIDFVSYRLFLWLGIWVAPAKAMGFITGTFFAWFANRLWTFQKADGGRKRFGLFISLYMATLLINVGLNSAVIEALGMHEFVILLAFVIATGVSATLNFVGMKFVVFKKNGEKDPSLRSG